MGKHGYHSIFCSVAIISFDKSSSSFSIETVSTCDLSQRHEMAQSRELSVNLLSAIIIQLPTHLQTINSPLTDNEQTKNGRFTDN